MPSKSLNDLTPDTRVAADSLLAAASAAGIGVIVTHTLRTCDEQNALYAQGRTAPGNKVTNAPGCKSWHVHGRALDLLVVEPGGAVVHNGHDPRYTKLGEIARTLGFKWGGDFGDYGHFEYHPGLRMSQVCPDPSDCSGIKRPSSTGPAAVASAVDTSSPLVAAGAGLVSFLVARRLLRRRDRFLDV